MLDCRVFFLQICHGLFNKIIIPDILQLIQQLLIVHVPSLQGHPAAEHLLDVSSELAILGDLSIQDRISSLDYLLEGSLLAWLQDRIRVEILLDLLDEL